MDRAALRRALAGLAACVAGCLAASGAHAEGRLQRGQASYMLHCSGCHLPDASGKPAAGIPDMRLTIPQLLRTPAGRAFLVQVPGTSGSALTDAQIAELMNWMLPALTGQRDVAPYTTQEVTRYRNDRLDDVAAHRAAILSGR
ncbi:c-type cytochrome [Cupriavidus lacunae]|uniref:Cytochrome C n=1 Tax=Cupriavidus lacunae TaxID=2666307 RepID=A0A370NQJ5_9BURK|nr:c-type cytochrome [Cupriavidus lacunae]RDK07892.1 cytochrome C [Cupriavidus lacunae]